MICATCKKPFEVLPMMKYALLGPRVICGDCRVALARKMDSLSPDIPRDSGFPDGMWRFEGDPKLLARVNKAKRMAVQNNRGLLLHGPSGAGKTLICTQLGRLLTCCGVRCVFVNVGALPPLISIPDREMLVQRVASAGHVIFDDVGCEAQDRAGNLKALIYGLIDSRYVRGLHFSVTTMNLDSIESQTLRRILDCTLSIGVG